LIVLIDTDVLIDVALGRAPHVESSARLLDAVERGSIRAFVAWHSISNFYYLVVGRRDRASARGFIRELTEFVDVAPTSTSDLQFAIDLKLDDFEDAMQVAAAAACGAEHIATRNVKDYQGSPVPAVHPESLF